MSAKPQASMMSQPRPESVAKLSARKSNYDLGIPMDEVVMDYITTVLNGTVAADKYGEPAGRIHVLVS